MDKKVCNKCGNEKLLDSFFIKKNGRADYVCKCCHKINRQIYYNNNKDKVLKATRRYYNDNKDKALEASKKYYNNNKDKIIERMALRHDETKRYSKSYYLINRDKFLEASKERHFKNKGVINKKQREYQTSEVAKAKRRIYRKSRMANDPNFKIRHNLKNRIRFALKGIAKSKSTLKLLGCDLPFFKKYLEEMFTEKMNWNNYGLFGWHIDHKKPCAAFDLTKKEEQEKCFHYTNMQPLWCTDNILKSDKLAT